MKAKISQDYKQIRLRQQQIGLIYGAVAGLFFAIGSWGLDARLLSGANAALPFAKLLVGGTLCLLLGGVGGWLAGRFDRALIALLVWAFLGGIFTWFAGHLPFEGLSWIFGYFYPEFKGLQVYPFVESAVFRTGIAIVISVILMMIGGGLQTMQTEAVRMAPNLLRRGFSFILLMPFFFVAGLFADNVINRPLRQPVVAMDELVRFALAHQDEKVDRKLASEMHLGALNAISSLLDQPRRLYLGSYEPTSMDSSTVLIDFSGSWARCNVLADIPSFCRMSDEVYVKDFVCLWQNTSQDCGVRLTDEARNWFKAWRSTAMLAQPEAQTAAQLGGVTLIQVVFPDGKDYQCRFREPGRPTLEACYPQPDSKSLEAAVGTLPVPTQETQGTAPTSELGLLSLDSQGIAMLPASRSDLASLKDFSRYSIQVTVDDTTLSYQGSEQLVYTNTEEIPLERLYFRLFPNGHKSYGNGSLTVSQALVNGQPVTTELSLSDSVLAFILPEVLEPGEQLRAAMDFNGTIPVDFGGGETPQGYGIYNYSQGVLALDGWYPLAAVYDDEGWNLDPVSGVGDSVYSDMAFYQVDLTAREDLVIVTTGVQLDQQPVAGGLVKRRFISGPVREFFMIAGADFQTRSRQVDGTQINSYYLPGHETSGETALQVSVDSFQTYSARFGLYPYTELDVVDAPMRNAGGVEFPGIVLIESSRYDDYQQPYFAGTVAHEVAHQWWYNLVGNDVIDEPWVDEGLTTFTSGLYWEAAYGRQAYNQVKASWQQSYKKLLEENQDDLVTLGLRHYEANGHARNYGPVVYSKAALFFDALRQEIGDQAFYNALSIYFNTYEYHIASGRDLLDAFEAAAGRSLEDLYQKWLYTTQ